MGLQYEDLDAVTRAFMVAEIERDIAADEIHRSVYLSQSAQGRWPDLMLEAAISRDDDWLTARLRDPGIFNLTASRQLPDGRVIQAAVPQNAAPVLAEGQFNHYYVRGLCRRAIAFEIPRLQVYRAKAVFNPRPESEEMIGLLVDPEIVLLDARSSIGGLSALGIPPGPGSGITVRIPKRYVRAA